MDSIELQPFFDKIKTDKHVFYKRFCKAIRGGKNTLYHNVVSEAITLDDSWITTLEQALFYVEKIVRNPRKFIIDEELLVDVARARRTTSKTVRHLSSNSQYVQNITEDGEIRPKKLLTTEMNEDLAIYENRFICTLVHHLVAFVENRYNDIARQMHSFDQTGAGIVSKFTFSESECELKMDLKVKEPPKNKVLLRKNNENIERIKQLRARLKILLNTEFIRSLTNKKPVRPPIMKTNLIKMNVDYNNCYKLWLYVSSYTFVGFSVKYQDKNLPVHGDFYDDLTMICALSFQSLMLNDLLNAEEYADLPFEDIKEKDFRVLTAYNFLPEFNADKTDAGDEVVNEYYFKAMRDELIKATRKGQMTVEKDVKLSFARFCRGISKINRKMYADVISSQIVKDKGLKEKTAIQKKEEAVRVQQAYLRRYRQLSLLKREELESVLKLEARELIKLEKLQAALDKEKGRQQNKRLRRQKERERLKNIKAKKDLALKNADEYESELREKEEERLAAIEEQKRLKREQAQRRRDLKRLEELKEKYDDET